MRHLLASEDYNLLIVSATIHQNPALHLHILSPPVLSLLLNIKNDLKRVCSIMRYHQDFDEIEIEFHKERIFRNSR